jgi:hypothetical protein
MLRYARTYGSENYPQNMDEAWQYTTGPIQDTFGVPVPELNKTFGLEEFNFNPFFLKEKIAYVPCYATAKYYPRPHLKELKLIFKTAGRCHLHYATLYDVTSIVDAEIPVLRNQIQPLMNEIYFKPETQAFFGDDFENYRKILDRMKDSNVIASNHDHTPFLVNVRYKELEILKTPIPCELNPKNVNQWKIEAEIPGNCSIINSKQS